MLAYRLGRHIQHLINTRQDKTGTYPDILKLSKITPQKKPDKLTNKIDSYRPINNLCTLDKIIEQYIKTHLDNYLDNNDIIHKHHHGSRRRHRDRQRQTETDRDGHTYTHAQTHRETNTQTPRQRQTETERDRQRQTETDGDRRRQTETD